MHNHKTHNQMQINSGKIAMTDSVREALRRKNMLARGGTVACDDDGKRLGFAKAVLMAEGGTVETPDEQMRREKESEDAYTYPDSSQYYDRTGDGYNPGTKEDGIRHNASIAKIQEYARQANKSIGSDIDEELLEFVFRSPAKYFEIASDPIAYKHYVELAKNAATDAELEEVGMKLADGKEFWSEVAKKYRNKEDGMLPGVDLVKNSQINQGLKFEPLDDFWSEESLSDLNNRFHANQPSSLPQKTTTQQTKPLRQYTDKKNVTHLTNLPQPVRRSTNRPPAPDIDAIMRGERNDQEVAPVAPVAPAAPVRAPKPPAVTARPAPSMAPPTQRYAKGGMINKQDRRAQFLRAIAKR